MFERRWTVDSPLGRLVGTQVYLSTMVMALAITSLPSRHPLFPREVLEDDRRGKHNMSSWSSCPGFLRSSLLTTS